MPRRPRASSSDEDDEGNIEGIVNDSEVDEDEVSTEPEEEEASMSDDSTSEEEDSEGGGDDGGPSANKGPRKRARTSKGGDGDGEGPDKAAARAAARRETEREPFKVAASQAKIKDLATPAAASAAAGTAGVAGGLRDSSGAFKAPQLLEGVRMHEHQQAALEWLAAVWREDRGALLCDQVGPTKLF